MQTKGASPFIAGDLSLADLFLAPILFYVSLTPDKDALSTSMGSATGGRRSRRCPASRRRCPSLGVSLAPAFRVRTSPAGSTGETCRPLEAPRRDRHEEGPAVLLGAGRGQRVQLRVVEERQAEIGDRRPCGSARSSGRNRGGAGERRCRNRCSARRRGGCAARAGRRRAGRCRAAACCRTPGRCARTGCRPRRRATPCSALGGLEVVRRDGRAERQRAAMHRRHVQQHAAPDDAGAPMCSMPRRRAPCRRDVLDGIAVVHALRPSGVKMWQSASTWVTAKPW